MGRRIKVLVADDSSAIQLFFRNAIAESGQAVELITVGNGAECAELLERGDIDLAFIEVNMPGMSGMEAVGAARHNGNQTFVTLMSAKVSTPRLQIARQLDVYEYLVKPFTAPDIDAVIATYRRVSQPMRTLIVDESRVVRGVIRRVLGRSMFDLAIEEAEDGLIALELCRESPFDIVFLDRSTPDLDGVAMLDRLLRRNRDGKVIVMSTERDPGSIGQAIARGAASFLQKPFYPLDVDRALHGALGLRMPALAELPLPRPERVRAPVAHGAIYLEDVA